MLNAAQRLIQSYYAPQERTLRFNAIHVQLGLHGTPPRLHKRNRGLSKATARALFYARAAGYKNEEGEFVPPLTPPLKHLSSAAKHRLLERTRAHRARRGVRAKATA